MLIVDLPFMLHNLRYYINLGYSQANRPQWQTDFLQCAKWIVARLLLLL